MAMNHTRRTFQINLRPITLRSEILNERVRMRLSPQAVRTVDSAGGLDAFILNAPMNKLPQAARLLKRRILRKRASESSPS